jgi:hypothetical protein
MNIYKKKNNMKQIIVSLDYIKQHKYNHIRKEINKQKKLNNLFIVLKLDY